MSSSCSRSTFDTTKALEGVVMTIIQILRCASCKQAIDNTIKCKSCQRSLRDRDGNIALIGDPATSEYRVKYVPLEFVKDVVDAKLCVPAAAGSSDIVYHLDKAHIPYFRALPPGARVLEIGCGGAQMRQWVISQGFEYLGTDVSKTRVTENLREFGGADFLSDAHNLPIMDHSIDLVYCAAVTEHLAAPHLVVQEIFRVLKSGGFFLGNCSFMEPWHDESFFHISPNGAVELLMSAGFETVAIWPSYDYSGFKALSVMGNRATSLFRVTGTFNHFLSSYFNGFKRFIRRDNLSADLDYAKSLATTAGAIDWVARKPSNERLGELQD